MTYGVVLQKRPGKVGFDSVMLCSDSGASLDPFRPMGLTLGPCSPPCPFGAPGYWIPAHD